MKLSKRTLIVCVIVHPAVVIALGAIAISTPLGRIAIYVSLALGAWLGLIAYSRWRWPRLACRACDGTGKSFEPSYSTLWVSVGADELGGHAGLAEVQPGMNDRRGSICDSWAIARIS
jgi:hypothetical protein